MTFPLLLHKCALNTISKKPILLYFVTKYGTGTIEFSRKLGYYHYGIGIFKACLTSKFSRKRKQLLSRILKLHIWQCIFLQDFGWLKPSFLRNHPYPKKKNKTIEKNRIYVLLSINNFDTITKSPKPTLIWPKSYLRILYRFFT